MPQPMLASPLVAALAFVALTISDAVLTVRAARLYRAGANEVIVLEGSYELNPAFVADVDRLRAISPRFLGLLAVYAIALWMLWYLWVRLLPYPQVYLLLVGGVLLVQGPIHVRHIRNLVAFRHALNRDGMEGRIAYTRRLSYRASAFEFLAFSGLYLVLALLSASWFLLGGALSCAAHGLQHIRLSRSKPALEPDREQGAVDA